MFISLFTFHVLLNLKTCEQHKTDTTTSSFIFSGSNSKRLRGVVDKFGSLLCGSALLLPISIECSFMVYASVVVLHASPASCL